MPLNTEIINPAGETVRPEGGWDGVSLSCMYTAAVLDSDPSIAISEDKTFADLEPGQWADFSMAPIYYLGWQQVPLVAQGRQTLTGRYEFACGDDRTVVFEAGTTLRVWRS